MTQRYVSSSFSSCLMQVEFDDNVHCSLILILVNEKQNKYLHLPCYCRVKVMVPMMGCGKFTLAKAMLLC